MMKLFGSFLVALWILAPAIVSGAPAKVLCLCDSIHRNTASAVTKQLRGAATVVVPKLSPGDTGTAIGILDELLGKEKWDLIYFNFGFADLRYKDPKTKSIRLLSKHTGGVRVSTPEVYEKNLQEIVEKLRATDAKLIWLNTTPIEGAKYDSILDSGSEITYNEIAARVMANNKIQSVDMHAWVMANVEKRSDPFSYKNISIHEPVAEGIRRALK